MKYGDIVIYKGSVGKVVGNENDYRFLPVNYGRYYTEGLDKIDEAMVRVAEHEHKLDFVEREFVWGSIKYVHCIGEYQIIEYVDKKTIECHSTRISITKTRIHHTTLLILL